MSAEPAGGRPASALAGADAGREVPRARLLLGLVLVLALALRLPGLGEPWSGKGFNSAIGAFGTAAFARNFVAHGFLESGLMPYRWRVELADGTVAREWYAHHPAPYAVATGLAVLLLGDEEWAVRLPWLLVSLFAIVALYRFLALVWGERVALAGALAYALVPFAAHYALMPWVDGAAIVAVYALVLRRYALWLASDARRDLALAALWVFVGGLLDWTSFFVLPAIGLHAALVCLRGAGGGRRFARTLVLPGAALLAVALHAAHMALVMPLAEIRAETAVTLERTVEMPLELGRYLGNQWRALARGLTLPVLVLVVVGLVRQTWAALRGRLGREEWLLAALLLPGPLYVALFPFRGANHDFMWCLALGWVAATAALECLGLRRVAARVLPSAAATALAALLGLGLAAGCVTRTLELWRETRSSAVAELTRSEWFRDVLGDPANVVVTSAGQGWTLLGYADAALMPRVLDVAALERRRAEVLSRLAPGRRVYFLFDLQLAPFTPELHAYLARAGPSTEHRELARADPRLDFEVFDLTEWARP